MDITPAQIRAARAMLNWSAEDLAAACEMTREGITRIERGVNRPHKSTLEALQSVFNREGIVFTAGNGVRQINDAFRLIEGPDPYLELLEDVFKTMRNTDGEVLYFYVDNALSPQSVIDSDLRMRNAGIKSRYLIDEHNPYCIFPIENYRCIPHADFHNNSIIVYNCKVGVMLNGNEACHLINNVSYANTMSLVFERLWKTHKQPKTNLAKVTYE